MKRRNGSLVATIKHICIVCGKEFYCSKLTSKIKCQKRKTCSKKCGAKISATTFKKGHKQLNTGKTHFKKGFKHSEETILKFRERKGSNSSNWKGGLTSINKAIRQSFEYKLWRVSVFVRDDRKCIWCGSGKQIEADHIKPFAFFPELRFAIDNGRTLCHECHETTDTYRRKNYV